MKIPSIFKNRESRQPPWQWTSCKHPQTLSFRANADVYKTVNSLFHDAASDGVEIPEPWFATSPECASCNLSEEDSDSATLTSSLETIIRGVRSSERLFFEPGDTSSILNKFEAKASTTTTTEDSALPFKESVALALESDDPYLDFKRSMQEMVEIHGLKDWECLEELLGWYLRINGKMNHGIIVGAFVDLLVGLVDGDINDRESLASSAAVFCSDSTSSYSSADSFLSSPCSAVSGPAAVGGDDQLGTDDDDAGCVV